ncbi:hypothetical protein UFOVP785_94 [uncultured Caudovirales phage]|uniref:Uncharacterized protein n=1 Tax=uncultured Caudovirales phage TaxID=2100421 RepID=A0A6J5NV97_9CAUD|nr:hypothetical protein UFOVP785_94 [uncultured Caudovirales phage]
MSYIEEAKDDASRMVDEFIDQIIEILMEGDNAPEDFNNELPGADRWHHETHIDREYDLEEAATLLRELREHKETDSGLWSSQEPEKAIASQAAYTYGNAVVAEWCNLMEKINDSDCITTLRDTILPELDGTTEETKAMELILRSLITKAIEE